MSFEEECLTPQLRRTPQRPPGIGTEAFARVVEQALDRIPSE